MMFPVNCFDGISWDVAEYSLRDDSMGPVIDGQHFPCSCPAGPFCLVPIIRLPGHASWSMLAPSPKKGVVMTRHLVIFKYRQTATKAQISQVTDAFRGLKDRMPGIVSFEHGANTSPEGRDLGFTHVYVLTFTDDRARDAYLPHPEHLRFVGYLERIQIIEDIFVVDYEPRN